MPFGMTQAEYDAKYHQVGVKIDDHRSWTQRIQDAFAGQMMDDFTKHVIENQIKELDHIDMMHRSSNEDRTTAKYLCYQYLRQFSERQCTP
jgi:hypothetical protein